MTGKWYHFSTTFSTFCGDIHLSPPAGATENDRKISYVYPLCLFESASSPLSMENVEQEYEA